MEKDGSYNLLTKWQGHEYIQIFLKDGDTYNETERKVQVSKVTQDGTGATFSYRVPDEWGAIDSYDVKMFTSPCFPKMMDGKVYYNASIIREPISTFQVPVYSEGEINAEGKLNATFHHYYTYELLHISNTSDSDIEFSLHGFEGTPWYKEKGSLCIDDGSFVVDAPSTKQPHRESNPITIKPGETQIIVSAYIPNGGTINDAKMVAKINGEITYSSNTKTSGIELKQGHAYHMYAGWNGEELKFWKDSEVPLDVRTVSASIDQQYLSGAFTGVVINPPLSEIKTGFRFWKENNPEDYVEYDSTTSDGGIFSLDLTFNDFVYIANESQVEGTYYVSAFAIDAKGNRHHGNTLEFTIDNGQPEVPVIPEPVDLGLPSGTKWSPYNIGATKPQEVGSYFAWGETSSKSSYDWSTYRYADGAEGTCHDIGDDISGTEYDVAAKRWGQSWSMPTVDQVHELIMNSTLRWTTEGGVYGVEITSRINGKSIFMPASGTRFETDIYEANRCFSWTGTLKEGNNNLANQLSFFYSDEIENTYASYGGRDRCDGLPVRPVSVNSEVATPEIVDLGLSVKWASFNLGATKPEEYGYYYAWGETAPKKEYSWMTYKWSRGDNDQLTKYCYDSAYGYGGFTDNISDLEKEDDAAYVALGDKWRMPTWSELNELRTKCTWTWKSKGGVNGCEITGPSGRTIFLPAAGMMGGSDVAFEGVSCDLWSSSIGEMDPDYACDLVFNSAHADGGMSARVYGLSIRPIYDESGTKPVMEIPEAIDLGLPSGIKWASFNLGATKPEEYGDYYAWGETEPYYISLDPLTWKQGKDAGYDWPSYKWCMGSSNTITKYCSDENDGYNGFTDFKTVLEDEDDAARMTLRSKWRMPTKDEWIELRNNCSWEWTSLNGVNGVKVTGSNGESIFLPAAGAVSNTILPAAGANGSYWSSSLDSGGTRSAYYLAFASNFVSSYYYFFRFLGNSVRPVYDDSIQEPNIQIPEPIDLGLPSGLKWASFNLGASKPEEPGDYYAWGETEPKYEGIDEDGTVTWKNGYEAGYTWSTYKLCEGSAFTLTKYNTDESYGTVVDNKTVLEAEDDAATVNLGDKWRMPTEGDWLELIENCTWTWTNDYNGSGVAGHIVTSNIEGYTSNSIFLSASGSREKTYLRGTYGNYWSSSLNIDDPYHARCVGFDGFYCTRGDVVRAWGRTVRPVYDDSEPDDNPWGHPGTGNDGGDNNSSGGDDGLD